jgi:hypothetical protein
MKKRTFSVFLILILVVMTIVGNCATQKKAITDSDFTDAFSGKWNTESDEAKLHPDFSWKGYYAVNDDDFSCGGRMTILDKWLDSKIEKWDQNSNMYLYFAYHRQ